MKPFKVGSNRLSESEMIKYAKDQLRNNKKIGLDKNLTLKDLDKSINAWSYLTELGLADSTEPHVWRYFNGKSIYMGNQLQ